MGSLLVFLLALLIFAAIVHAGVVYLAPSPGIAKIVYVVAALVALVVVFDRFDVVDWLDAQSGGHGR